MSNFEFSNPHPVSAEKIIFRHYCDESHRKVEKLTVKDFVSQCSIFEHPKIDIKNPLYDIWKQSQQCFFDKKLSNDLVVDDKIYVMNSQVDQQFDQIINTKESYLNIWHTQYYDMWTKTPQGFISSLLHPTDCCKNHFEEMKNSGFFDDFEFVQNISDKNGMTTKELLKRKCINQKIREFATTNFSWSIPCCDTIQTILDFSIGKSIIDICSGKGYWNYILSQCRKRVISVDKSYKNSQLIYRDIERVKTKSEYFTFAEIVCQDASDYIKEHDGCQNDVLFMSWMNSSKLIENCLEQYKGSTIIIIGEDEGGCTGVLTDTANWTLELKKNIPNFHSIYDNLKIFKRK